MAVPLSVQGVAGDPLARGEGQSGVAGAILSLFPTTYEEAVHGVVILLIRHIREGAGQASGGVKDFHTGIGTGSTRNDDAWHLNNNQSILTRLTYPLQ